MNDQTRGFTLIEVLVVIFLIGIISAIATPNILSWRSNAKLRGAATNLKSDLELAKLKAIQENGWVAINFTEDGYVVFKDDGGGLQGVHDPNEDLYGSRSLPAGVKIDLGETTFADDGQGGQYTRFSGKGTANDGTAHLVNSSGTKKRVVINVLGRIKIESGEAT